jgi:hypothetical protein
MREQIQHRLRDVVWRELPVGATGIATATEAGGDRTGHDVGNADVVVPHFLHQRLAELVQAGLGSAIRSAVGEPVLAGQAADVDDPPATPLAQVRDRGVAAVKNAAQVGIEDLPPLGGGHVGNRRKQPHASVVDEDVEAAEPRRGIRDRFGGLRLVLDVSFQRKRLASELCPRGFECRWIASGDRYRRTGVSQRTGDREPDTARSAGDDGGAPGERCR